MRRLNKTIMAIGAMAIFPAVLPAQQVGCQGIMFNTRAVALAAPRSGPLVNFTGSGGQLDPVPLLETNINIIGIPGHAVCVTVTFSAQVDPVDNYGVYQTSIDNVPMAGHASLLSEYGLTTPIVFDAVNQGSFIPNQGSGFLNPANSRMVSYRFFASVMPGTRTIRVRVAGCCSPIPIGITPVFVGRRPWSRTGKSRTTAVPAVRPAWRTLLMVRHAEAGLILFSAGLKKIRRSSVCQVTPYWSADHGAPK